MRRASWVVCAAVFLACGGGGYEAGEARRAVEAVRGPWRCPGGAPDCDTDDVPRGAMRSAEGCEAGQHWMCESLARTLHGQPGQCDAAVRMMRRACALRGEDPCFHADLWERTRAPCNEPPGP